MKILSITAQKPDSTGSGIYLSALMNAFSDLGHEQMLIYGKSPEDSRKFDFESISVDFETEKLPFKIFGMSDTMPYPASRYKDMSQDMLKAFKAAYTQAIKKALHSFSPDLIICHHLYEVTAIVAHIVFLLPVDKRPKIVGITHGTCLLQMQKHNLDREYIQEGISLLDQIYCLTNTQISKVSEIYGIDKERIQLIGTGYDAELFNDKHMKAHTIQPPYSILYVGKISAQKGVAQLITSLNYLSLAPSELTLTLVGGEFISR